MREEAQQHGILAQLQSGQPVSQRSIARELGIALGLTNVLIRRMARKGFIRLVRVRPNRILYLITPAGLAEKTRMSVAALKRNVESYSATRDLILARFAAISNECGEHKRIVFFGADEVAEIGYVCLQDTDLQLAGVIDDDSGRRQFFGLPVRSSSNLQGDTLENEQFDRLLIMRLTEIGGVLANLDARGVPREKVSWLV